MMRGFIRYLIPSIFVAAGVILFWSNRDTIEIDPLKLNNLAVLAHNSAITPIIGIIDTDSGVICLLRPYSSGIVSKEFEHFNEKLQRSNVLPLSEGNFIIVWFQNDNFKINKYDRRSRFDITPRPVNINIEGIRYSGVECEMVDRAFLYLTFDSPDNKDIRLDLVRRQ